MQTWCQRENARKGSSCGLGRIQTSKRWCFQARRIPEKTKALQAWSEALLAAFIKAGGVASVRTEGSGRRPVGKGGREQRMKVEQIADLLAEQLRLMGLDHGNRGLSE
jgi:hypothetical protein